MVLLVTPVTLLVATASVPLSHPVYYVLLFFAMNTALRLVCHYGLISSSPHLDRCWGISAEDGDGLDETSEIRSEEVLARARTSGQIRLLQVLVATRSSNVRGKGYLYDVQFTQLGVFPLLWGDLTIRARAETAKSGDFVDRLAKIVQMMLIMVQFGAILANYSSFFLLQIDR